MAKSLDSFNDLKELGINLEDDSLTETFNKAANHLPSLLPSIDNQTLLTLYAYYKQGSQGPCNSPKPSWYDMKAKSKWEAWNKLGKMPQYEAKTFYIETIKKLDPNFNLSSGPKESWVSVSTLQKEPNVVEKNIFDHVKDGNTEELLKVLKSPFGQDYINQTDEDGLGLIHWAADRGSVEILKILLDLGVDINLRDTDGQTALHYASSCGHADCIKFLLENNANRDIVDNDDLSPESVASDDTVKELLMNFL